MTTLLLLALDAAASPHYRRGVWADENSPTGRTGQDERTQDAGRSEARDPSEGNSASARAAEEAAERLRGEWEGGALRAAIAKYKEALSYWQDAGSHQQEATVLKRIGDLYGLLDDRSEALNFYKQAFEKSSSAMQSQFRVDVLNAMGSAYAFRGETQKALDFCNRALTSSRDAGYRPGEAEALNNLGEIHYFGDMGKALDLFNQALAIWQELGDRRGQAVALTNIGYIYIDQSKFEEATTSLRQALEHWQAVGDRLGEGRAVNAMGVLSSLRGEKQEALEFHRHAKLLFQTLGNRSGELTALNGIGFVYDELGEKRKALDSYAEALELCRAVGRREGELVTLVHLGNIQEALADQAAALDSYQQALALSRALGDMRMQAYCLNYLGRVFASAGHRSRALEYYRRALLLSHAGHDLRGQASVLNSIGYVYHQAGQQKEALRYYKKSLSLNMSAEDRQGESLTRYHIARAERSLGNLAASRSEIETAIRVVESLRSKVASHDLRASYFATVHEYYALYVDVLMQSRIERPTEGLESLALQVSEQARSRGLLEILAESAAKIRQSIDPALADKERRVQQSLNAKADAQMQMLSGEHSEEQAASLAKEIRELTDEYNQIEAEIREKSPRYAALTQPRPLDVVQIQSLLDDDTLLLEYFLGDERSYLWAVSQAQITTYELPGRTQVEAAARRVYSLLTAQQPAPGETFEQRQERIDKAEEDYWPEARTLSSMVLGPVKELQRAKRLLVVADGALLYVPFAALPAPVKPGGEGRVAEAAQSKPDEHAPSLVVSHEIANLPSASVLAAIRSEAAHRTTALKEVAVLADPVFESDDPRIQAVLGRDAPQEAAGLFNLKERQEFRDVELISARGTIPRLLASRAEANMIMETAPAGAGFEALDFDASLATITSPEISRYRIVHFATHSIIDNTYPEISGILLSLYNRQGRRQDGVLRLHEIYKLHLPVDLVVLSACKTGLGKNVRGEGLIGLTHGFMYAGASGVMASLWKVDDEATAEMMKQFYEGVLVERLSPAAALRKAQMAMRNHPRWRAPFYWAAFVLQGEYRGATVARPGTSNRWLLVGSASLVLSALLIYVLFARLKAGGRSDTPAALGRAKFLRARKTPRPSR